QGVHLVNKLLSHCFTQLVRLPPGEVGQQTGEKHHLLLVYRDTVGLAQVFFHDGEVVRDLLPPMFTGNKRGYVIHWTGAVESVHRNKILEPAWLKLLKVLLHTGRLKLERARCLSIAIETIRGFIVHVDGIDVNLYAAV